MQLEQTLEIYQQMQTQRTMPERRQRSYTIVDLESLSASALYTGEIQNGASDWVGNMSSLGGGDIFGGTRRRSIFDRLDESVEEYKRAHPSLFPDKPSMGTSRPLKYEPRPFKYEPLTIRDLPESGVQLHIHEQPGGKAHLKYNDGTYSEINSYDAAMADKLAQDQFNFKRFLSQCKLRLSKS